MLLIDREYSDNVLLIDSKHSGNVLLIDRKLAELEDDVEYASFLKFTELVKKPSILTKTGKKKPHCPIFYFFAYFIEPVRQLCFCFAENLAGLTDSLAIGGAESRGEEVAVDFFGWFLWNMEIIFRRCMTVEDGFQVLFFSE